MSSLLRRSVAEALGTFGLVFFGAGAVIANVFPGANYGLIGIALVHAIVLSVMVSATMNISGGHLNPAVTISLLVARRTDAQSAIAYIIAQLIGAVLAALALKMLLPSQVVRGALVGTPSIASTITVGRAVAIEALLTFFLVSAVFGTAVSPEAPKIGGFGIGLVLFFDIMVGGPLTGAVMNPARAFGPSVVSGAWTGHIYYWIGPVLGGVIAAILWDKLLLPKRTA
jgi:aquaporin TIP